MRILVVEDDKKTGAFIAKALKAAGYAVDVLRDGDDALAAIESTPFDAVVLDIMLIGRDGLRVEGLDAGAEDYLPKPFALQELTAPVRALARRGGDVKSTKLRVGDLTLDTMTRQ